LNTWTRSTTISRRQSTAAAFDRFEGRDEMVRPGRLPEIPVTTHANVELPPHVDTGTEAPPPKAVLHI
jgi:hypothetical protein